MNNKGDHTRDTIQVADEFTIKPKDQVIESYSGGKSANIKFIEEKKNRSFPFILALIIILLVVMIWNVVGNTKEIKEEKKNTTTETTTTTGTTGTTSVNIENSEISNFSDYLANIISGEDGFDDNYDKYVKYKGMYFKFTCASFNYEVNRCVSGSGKLVLPGDVTINLYSFDTEKENFIENGRNLYLSLYNDKILIVKSFEEPGTSSFVLYSLDGKFLGSKNNITTSYYDGSGLMTALMPTLSNENSPLSVSYYECKKNNKSKQNIGYYKADIYKNMQEKEQTMKFGDKDVIFSCHKVEQ